MVKWRGREGSGNVIDSRGARTAGGAGLALVAVRLIMSRFGIGGIVILGIAFVGLSAIGLNPLTLLSGGAGGGSGGGPVSAADEEAGQFVSVILRETEIVWDERFASAGSRYQAPSLVLFTGGVQSACGGASSAAGPFYCPADQRVYLDTSFFAELSERFGAPGDFAAAYVVAHEVGHHIQTITGVSKQVREAQARASQAESNALQVRMELQADCYAGLWAHDAGRTRDLLEAGDIEEGLRAASAIGDDTLQRNAGRRVTPESFTHGTSEQRMRWFRRGYDSGDVAACDAFAVANP